MLNNAVKRIAFIICMIAVLMVLNSRLYGFLSTAQAEIQNSITISFTQEPDNLNPLYSTQDFAGLARSLFLKPAWVYNDHLNLIPVLVKEIPSKANGGISADGKTITLHIRDYIFWSDDVPITANDFVFTAQMYASEKNTILNRAPYNQVTVASLDSQTVTVTFPAPYPAWPATLFNWVLPAHALIPIFEKNGSLDNADWNTNPTVSDGPFILKDYQKGKFMRFVRNDKYSFDKPRLDQITIQIVPDDAAQLALVKANDAEIAYYLTPIDATDISGNYHLVIQDGDSGYNEGLFFNLSPDTGNPALQDIRVRQAIDKAIDRQSITDQLLFELIDPSAGLWDLTPYQDPSIQPTDYDLARAKQLLDDAGYKVGANGMRVDKAGNPLSLRYVTNMKELRKVAQRLITDQLTQLGITIKVINDEDKDFLAPYEKDNPLARGEFDLAEWSVRTRFPDPGTNLFLISEIGARQTGFAGANWSHLEDSDLDELFQQEQQTVDIPDRVQIFHQISKIIHDKIYWLPLWHDSDLWAVNQKHVQGVKLGGPTPWWNVTEWSVVTK